MAVSRLAIVLSGAAAVTVLAGLVSGLLVRQPSGAVPVLPSVHTDELISSVQRAAPVALAGTVRWQPTPDLAGALPAEPSRTVRLWSDTSGRWRVSLPTPDGERTIVDDGSTTWLWNSATRSITQASRRSTSPVLPSLVPLPDPAAPSLADQRDDAQRGELVTNPVALATAMIALVQPDSTAHLDQPEMVAGRAAYQLVLNPLPTERTLLREIRVAVDSQTRLPLAVSVLANGSAQPALRVGFTQLSFGPQDPALFAFTPPARVAVRRMTSSPGPLPRRRAPVVGRGWDTVLVRQLSAADRGAGGASAVSAVSAASADRGTGANRGIGRPFSGPWGQGRLMSTPIGNALLTADGRLACGAVPAQVLSEALGR